MTQGRTDLSQFNNDWYEPGSSLKRAIWYFFNLMLIRNRYFPFMGIKKLVLRVFGAKVGKGVILKPGVSIKYPWKLSIGSYTWIGEGVWIDNLGEVRIGGNVCLSQGAMLLCGNHDYSKVSFDLMVGDITLEDGVWIGAQAIVCPGVTCSSHAVLAVKSVATKNLDPNGIYQGNPAVKIKERTIS